MGIAIIFLLKLLLTALLTMMSAVVILWPIIGHSKPVGFFPVFLFVVVEALMVVEMFF